MTVAMVLIHAGSLSSERNFLFPPAQGGARSYRAT